MMQRKAREGATLFEKIMQTQICEMFELFELSEINPAGSCLFGTRFSNKEPKCVSSKGY